MAKVYATYQHHMAQLGREATAGTAVAATTVWRGPYAGFQDTRNREVAEEDVGVLMSQKRSYDTWLGVKIPVSETKLTFEQVNHFFEGGIATVTPSGTSPTITRLYAWDTTGAAQPAIKTYTTELANTLALADGKKIPFCFVDEFTLSGKNGEAWTMGGSWMGQQLVALGTFTAAIAKPVVEVAQFAKTTLFIDPSGAAAGTTAKLGVLMGASIKVKTGIEYVPVGDGSLFYTAIKRGRPEVSFTLTLELEQDTGVSTVAVERAAFDTDAFRIIRLNVAGSGTHKLMIDLCGRYASVGQPSKEGQSNTTVTFEGMAEYNATDSLFAQFTTITSSAALA